MPETFGMEIMPASPATPATPAIDPGPPAATVTVPLPVKAKPPVPAAMDGISESIRHVRGEEGDAVVRLHKVRKLLEGMGMGSHESRWLRDAMVLLIEAIAGKEPVKEPVKEP